jgi:hypothetical protein
MKINVFFLSQMLILNMAHFLPAAGVGDEARVQYKQTFRALDEFMRKYYNEWTFTLDNVNNFSFVLIINVFNSYCLLISL